jgi:hypothetical protein
LLVTNAIIIGFVKCVIFLRLGDDNLESLFFFDIPEIKFAVCTSVGVCVGYVIGYYINKWRW